MDFTPLDSEQLMILAQTSTVIKKDLSNLCRLTDFEYENLVYNVVVYLTATNPMLLSLGACYSKLIYSCAPERFDMAILALLESKKLDINKYEDFYAVDIVLSFCESKIYDEFLKISLESSDVDVKEEANKSNDENLNTMWFKYYSKLYLEFISYLHQG